MLVFSGVVAAKVMRPSAATGWGTAVHRHRRSALASGCVWGLLNGVLIAKAKIPPLIVTLGSLGMALGLAQIITGGHRHPATSRPCCSDTIGYGRMLSARSRC